MINFVNVLISSIALGLLKIHELTFFHVFITLLFSIIVLETIVSKIDTNQEIHKFNNVYSVFVLFYIAYSDIAEKIYIVNPIFTNLISANFLLIAVGSSFFRSKMTRFFQENLVVVCFFLLCFPINIIQNTDWIELLIRKFIFLIVFNIEVYIGTILDYKTNFKQLFLVSYYIFVVDVWYLLGSIVIVLSHFLEINKQVYNKTETKDDIEDQNSTDDQADLETISLLKKFKKSNESNTKPSTKLNFNL